MEEEIYFHVFPPEFPTCSRCLRFKRSSMYWKIIYIQENENVCATPSAISRFQFFLNPSIPTTYPIKTFRLKCNRRRTTPLIKVFQPLSSLSKGLDILVEDRLGLFQLGIYGGNLRSLRIELSLLPVLIREVSLMLAVRRMLTGHVYKGAWER